MARTSYIDFVNNYLVKNGMIGNAINMNKAPDQLKIEIDEIYNDLYRADKYLAGLNIVNMLYTDNNLTKIRYTNDTDVDYETLVYANDDLTTINHYIGGVLKGTTTLSYSGQNLVSAVFVGV